MSNFLTVPKYAFIKCLREKEIMDETRSNITQYRTKKSEPIL